MPSYPPVMANELFDVIAVVPYEDIRAGHDFLVDTLGFTSAGIVEGGDGEVVHAEVRAGDRRIWLHAAAGGLTTPRLSGSATGGIVVHVADVDAHFDHARSAGAHDPPRTDRRGLRPARVRRARSRGPQLVHRHAVQRACGVVAVVVSPSRRRTTFRAMSSTAGSSRRTKLALAARMMPFSSKVSASGSSSAGSSCCSSAVTANWRIECREPVLERGDPFLDRSRTGAHLEDRAGEEATAGERAPREVVEERVAHRDELSESGRSGERRLDDLGLEDPTGFVDGGELQLLLRAEVGVDRRSCSCRARRRGCRSRGPRGRRRSRATRPRARSPRGCVRRRRVVSVAVRAP